MAAEDKSKQLFTQNEHGKFENKTAPQEQDVDIEELRRENQLLKEKLNAIQKDADASNAANAAAAEKPPKCSAPNTRPKSLSASSEELREPEVREKSTRGRSPRRSNSFSRPEKYWQWYGDVPGGIPGELPCQYNPHCYSGTPYDPIHDEYLADMLYRYPDYFGTRNNYHSARTRAKSYDNINRILEVNALYDNNYPRRWRPRTRSMEGRITPVGVAPSPIWDPYFTTWKHTGGPRIPFAPRSVWDLCVGMKVSMHRSDGRLSRGTIRWIGLLPNLVGEYVGVELETQTGRHDGYLNGVRYFKCKEKCGIFVKFSKIIMAWR